MQFMPCQAVSQKNLRNISGITLPSFLLDFLVYGRYFAVYRGNIIYQTRMKWPYTQFIRRDYNKISMLIIIAMIIFA
jgi:hypothetical protein